MPARVDQYENNHRKVDRAAQLKHGYRKTVVKAAKYQCGGGDYAYSGREKYRARVGFHRLQKWKL